MMTELKSLYWIEELLPHDVIPRKMQGGVGYFLNEKFVLLLIESSLTREHKGIEYPFQLWKGCFFPIEKIKQNAVIARFPVLENHPASPKWLYLPEETEDFEEHVKNLLREIKKGNPLFGLIPKMAAPKKGSSIADDDEVDLSKPQSFRDKPASLAEKEAHAQKVRAKKEKSTKNQAHHTKEETESGKARRASLVQSDKKIKANKKPENSFILDLLKRKSK